MKRFTFIYFITLTLVLSSCVYSLFPIYTPETLTYWPELNGKWKTGDSYLSFTSLAGGRLEIDLKPRSDEFIIENGDTIRDQNKIKESLETSFPRRSEKGYLMERIEDSDTLKFHTRLAHIGEDYFLDLYPLEADEFIDENYFPVHTFMKIRLKNNLEMELTPFDMSKLIDLFNSNQIRLRHEKVDEAIMITARPEEIQKFLKAYSKDESVFEEAESYQKVAS